MARILHLLFSFLLLASLGCGGGPEKPKLYPVSGKVTVDGKAPANVAIHFLSTANAGISYGGTIAADGSYSLSDGEDQRPGAQAGKYKVVLSLTGEAMTTGMMASMKQGQTAPSAPSAPFPPEYNSASTSPKEVEVKAESNTIDISIP